MAYSYVVYTGNGSTTQFAITFPYIRKEHVKVYVNYVDTAYTYVNDTTVQLAAAPASPLRVEVRRVTPLSTRLVDYTDGSTLVAADLDTSNLQSLYNEQELDDNQKRGIFVDDATGLITAGSQRITSVANPVNAQDAATKTYVDTADALKVAKAGDSMTGALAMGTNKITGLGTPTVSTDAATKAYVDATITTGNISTSGNIATTGTLTVQGITVGKGAGAISTNTVLGNTALGVNTTGFENTAIGKDALFTNATGSSNTACGINTLFFNVSGIENTAIGGYALQHNTTGNLNTACGQGNLYSNTTGNSNTAYGAFAIFSNTTGTYNTATGTEALKSNTTGITNTANGLTALFANTTGNYNTAIGASSLYSNTIGTSNVAVGVDALYSNTTGVNNTATGLYALRSNTTGSDNTAIGLYAGRGDNSQANTTGTNNTFIGANAMGASATASNVITLGNGSIATLRCQVTTITALSDARDKTDISNIPAGLGFINALRPVAFKWNTRDGAKVGIPEFGFIAQELLEVQASTGITVPNLVSAENPDRLEASAGTLLPVLVNAVQELTAMVKNLQSELSILKGA